MTKTEILNDGSMVISKQMLDLASEKGYDPNMLFFLVWLYTHTEVKLGSLRVRYHKTAIGKQLGLSTVTIGKRMDRLIDDEVVYGRIGYQNKMYYYFINEEL